MANVLTLCWKYLRALLLIYLCLFVGNALAALLPFAIPGSILGMLLLFALLSTQILPAKWVKPGCHLLIRYMVLLFVPIGVGVMKYYDQIVAHLGPLVILPHQHADGAGGGRLYSHYFHRERRIAGKPDDTEGNP